MGHINKYPNQTVFDVLLENSGAISGLFDFLEANNLQELDIPEGEYLAPALLKPEIVTFYKTNKIKLLSGIVIEQSPGSWSDSFSISFG